MTKERACRVCGCTDDDCRKCIEKTGTPCHWVGTDLCSACNPDPTELVLVSRARLRTMLAVIGEALKIHRESTDTKGMLTHLKSQVTDMLEEKGA